MVGEYFLKLLGQKISKKKQNSRMNPTASKNCTIAWKRFLLKRNWRRPKKILFSRARKKYLLGCLRRTEWSFYYEMKSQRDEASDFVDIFEDVVQFLFLFFRPLFFFERSRVQVIASWAGLRFIEIWTNFISRRTQTKLNFSLPFVSWISDAGLPTLD